MSIPQPLTLADAIPTVENIAQQLLAWSEVDPDTGERTLTDDTNPTRQEAELAIINAASEANRTFGLTGLLQREDITAEDLAEARRLTTLRAAAQLLDSLDDPSTETTGQRARLDAQWIQTVPDFIESLNGGVLDVS